MFKSMKYRFEPKCRDIAYKGPTKKVSAAALNREKQLVLIYTLVEVFIFKMKNAVA